MSIKPTPKFILLLGALGLAGVLTLATAHAADNKDDKAKRERNDRDDDNLKRYDKNANGKLDPDEEAEMKADQEKAKRKKKG